MDTGHGIISLRPRIISPHIISLRLKLRHVWPWLRKNIAKPLNTVAAPKTEAGTKWDSRSRIKPNTPIKRQSAFPISLHEYA